MGILDLALQNERQKEKQAEPTPQKEITPIQHTAPPSQSTTTSSGSDEQKVYVDGPISTVITHALNVVYANDGKDTNLHSDDQILTQPANEEASMDSAVISSILMANSYRDHTDEVGPNDVYVYATDDSHVEDVDDVNNQLGDLKIALDKCKANRKIFVMESHHLENPRIALLATYADENGFEVIYTREKLLRSI